MPDGADEDLKHVEHGSKSGREKINKTIDKVNLHHKLFKKLKKMSPYFFVFCVDDTPQLFEMLARKTDGIDTIDEG